MRFANGIAVGTSDVWRNGEYCKILTAAGLVGCAIFDVGVAAEFGDSIAIVKGTPGNPLGTAARESIAAGGAALQKPASRPTKPQ